MANSSDTNVRRRSCGVRRGGSGCRPALVRLAFARAGRRRACGPSTCCRYCATNLQRCRSASLKLSPDDSVMTELSRAFRASIQSPVDRSASCNARVTIGCVDPGTRRESAVHQRRFALREIGPPTVAFVVVVQVEDRCATALPAGVRRRTVPGARVVRLGGGVLRRPWAPMRSIRASRDPGGVALRSGARWSPYLKRPGAALMPHASASCVTDASVRRSSANRGWAMTCSRDPTAVAGDPASSHALPQRREAVRRVRVARDGARRRGNLDLGERGAHFAFRIPTGRTHTSATAAIVPRDLYPPVRVSAARWAISSSVPSNRFLIAALRPEVGVQAVSRTP